MPYVATSPDDLCFTKELHRTSWFNKDLWLNDPRIYKPTCNDVLPPQEDSLRRSKLLSLNAAFAWHIREILVKREPAFAHYQQHLGLPAAIEVLPTRKTVQYPANAINADESQNDGNWEVLTNLLDQVCATHLNVLYLITEGTLQSNIQDNSLEEFVTLVHGDLSTKERIDALRKMCTIEHSTKNWLGWVVFVPGMFHFKMACTDAFWRIHINPKMGWSDPTSFFEYIRHLRPREMGKFGSGPGFRRMHDAIHHTVWANILDCWRIATHEQGFSSVADFAKSEPGWDVICHISDSMVTRYLPGHDFQDIQDGPVSERDLRFENQKLLKQHSLLYLVFSRAINFGDVGRILQLFPYWIAIFTATGKHKYAIHMIQFKTDLDHVYPPRLRYYYLTFLTQILTNQLDRNAILQNWLCNPTGKVDGWRGYDWLQERNNLYTKVSYW